MKINAVTPLGPSLVRGAVEERASPPTPVARTSCDDQRISWEVQRDVRVQCRSPLPSLRYQVLHNAPIARANTSLPGQHTTDSQLVEELCKNFGELYSFSNKGCLTQSSLACIAAQPLAGD